MGSYQRFARGREGKLVELARQPIEGKKIVETEELNGRVVSRY